MWALITSEGWRVTDIRSEQEARWTAHGLGTTPLRGPFSWDVVDDQGRRFVVEIRRRSGGFGRECRTPPTQRGHRRCCPGAADHRRGTGVIVGTNAIQFKVRTSLRRVRESRTSEMTFHIGDEVRQGTRIGTVTDVGTVLIQVRSTEGTARLVCPWDIVKVPASQESMTSAFHHAE